MKKIKEVIMDIWFNTLIIFIMFISGRLLNIDIGVPEKKLPVFDGLIWIAISINGAMLVYLALMPFVKHYLYMPIDEIDIGKKIEFTATLIIVFINITLLSTMAGIMLFGTD